MIEKSDTISARLTFCDEPHGLSIVKTLTQAEEMTELQDCRLETPCISFLSSELRVIEVQEAIARDQAQLQLEHEGESRGLWGRAVGAPQKNKEIEAEVGICKRMSTFWAGQSLIMIYSDVCRHQPSATTHHRYSDMV